MSDAADAQKELEADLEGTEIVDAPVGAKIAAPLIALGATWAVREVLERVYTKITGNKPPHASDPDQRMGGHPHLGGDHRCRRRCRGCRHRPDQRAEARPRSRTDRPGPPHDGAMSRFSAADPPQVEPHLRRQFRASPRC